jgi:hypothetical protein
VGASLKRYAMVTSVALGVATWTLPAAAQTCTMPTVAFNEPSLSIAAVFRESPRYQEFSPATGGTTRLWEQMGGDRGCAISLSVAIHTPGTSGLSARENVDIYIQSMIFGRVQLLSRRPARRFGPGAQEVLRSWPAEGASNGLVNVGVRHIRAVIVPRGGKLVTFQAMWEGGPNTPPDAQRFFDQARVR